MSRQRWWTLLLERGDGIRGWFSAFWERTMLNESGKSASVLCVVMHEWHIPPASADTGTVYCTSDFMHSRDILLCANAYLTRLCTELICQLY